MSKQKTEILADNQTGIARAVALLRRGRLVAFPTETVYGLGADAGNDSAVSAIFAAKNRPQFNPLIVHVQSASRARDIARFNTQAQQLADAFWPGPLTLVVPLKPGAGISPLASAGLDTVAIRVPKHPLAQSLLSGFSHPIVAPSANPSGGVSPTTTDHVIAGLGTKIAAVMDGGACAVGLESTIIGFENGPTLLRPGGLPLEVIGQCLGQPLRLPPLANERPNAPGQLASHYAPNALIRLNANSVQPGETLLGFGPMACDLNLSATGDLSEAAANLFSHLRMLDAKNVPRIAVSPIPDHGLGHAINDRLMRAAAPRP
ncbi:MAG: L-threonylcarbamoyladenylate synthase [Paracoccaceae bacterium]